MVEGVVDNGKITDFKLSKFRNNIIGMTEEFWYNEVKCPAKQLSF